MPFVFDVPLYVMLCPAFLNFNVLCTFIFSFGIIMHLKIEICRQTKRETNAN